MEGVTLVESGTVRAHFALVKSLESASSAKVSEEQFCTQKFTGLL